MNRPTIAPIGVVIVLMLTVATALGQTGWRTDGTGRYPGATPLLKWSSSEGVIWKTPLNGWSNATPVVARDRIFLCREPTTLLSLDAKTGQILWQVRNDYADVMPPDKAAPTPLPPTHSVCGYSSPTPVVQGKHVYVLFGNGVAACYDMKGNRVWGRLVEKPTHGWGHSASPVMADGKVIVHLGSTVHALDPRTGDTLWKAQSGSNWGTPLPVSIGKEKAIVTTGGDILAARDGKYLARAIASMPWTSPVVDKGVLYVVDEAGAVAYRLPWEVTEPLKLVKLWTARPPVDRYYASPVVHEGLIYAVTQGGMLSVIDAAVGTIVYSRHIPLGGTFYPSICLAGNRIFVSSDSGRTVVLEPGREYREVFTNSLEGFRSTPVFSGNRMFVRTFNHLFCIGK